MNRLMAGIALVLGALGHPAQAGSIRFVENRPMEYDFVDIARIPAGFGSGEFTLELWIKPDASYDVGPVWRAGYNQLRNWSDADPEPYSSDGWWLSGNWLLDGHSRPDGFNPGDSREGTFSLQFYGGGRLRWMFSDSRHGMPKGMVYAVQAWPATTAPSLLDGEWHHVAAVRRWREPAGATLELWIDGQRLAVADIPTRTDMRPFWDRPAHPRDPHELGGWSLGAEVMTAWNYAFTQYEDYKGWLDDLRFWGRALSPAEIARLAEGDAAGTNAGLLAQYDFEDGSGAEAKDATGRSEPLRLHRSTPRTWSAEKRPRR